MKKLKMMMLSIALFVVMMPVAFAMEGYYYETDDGTYMTCLNERPFCQEVRKGQSNVIFDLKHEQIVIDDAIYYFSVEKQEQYYMSLYGKTRMYYYMNGDKYVLCKTSKSCKSYTFDKLNEMGANIYHPSTISFNNGDGPGVPGDTYYYNASMGEVVDSGSNTENNGNGGNNEVVTSSDTCTRLKEPLKFLGNVLLIVKILIPAIIVGFGIYDFFKAVTGSKDDEIKKSIKSLVFRCAAGVVIFLIPTIVSVVFSLVDSWANIKGEFNACQKCVLNVSKCK